MKKFEKEYLEYLDTHHREIEKSIITGKTLTDEIKSELEEAIVEFKKNPNHKIKMIEVKNEEKITLSETSSKILKGLI